jgi:hypothetical protein
MFAIKRIVAKNRAIPIKGKKEGICIFKETKFEFLIPSYY